MLGLHFNRKTEEMAHCDSKGVAVGDFIVYNGLNVDGLQLEVNCHIYQPGDKYKRETKRIQRDQLTL